eukprot:TRINITY_DN2202_c0_g1_i1.p1 TRINITY_DN2202_c0_g1~~TRINITY_DN2202_c0_g1_i1.p1  ORF type:complete len:465 (+),score=45.52 TRINITY_DN2202_c0_g1_i1:22-1416(+)
MSANLLRVFGHKPASSALQLAVEKNNLEEVTQLLQAGDFTPEEIQRCFHQSLERENAEIAGVLYQGGVVPNGYHLQQACMSGLPSLVSVLLGDDRIPEIDKRPHKLLRLPCMYNTEKQIEILGFFTKNIEAESKPYLKAFLDACSSGSLNLVVHLVNNFITPRNHHYSYIALNSAATHGHTELVKYLLACPKFEVDKKENQKAIGLACFHGHIEVLKLLASDKRFQLMPNDLYFAISHLDCLKYLYEDCNLSHVMKYQVFCSACCESEQEAVKFFLGHGVDPSRDDNKALRKLCCSPNAACLGVAKLLLADPRVDPCANSHEPLRKALKSENWPLVDLLLTHEKMDLSNLNDELLFYLRPPPLLLKSFLDHPTILPSCVHSGLLKDSIGRDNVTILAAVAKVKQIDLKSWYYFFLLLISTTTSHLIFLSSQCYTFSKKVPILIYERALKNLLTIPGETSKIAVY